MARRWNILGSDGAHGITNENETAKWLQKLNLEKHETVSWQVHEVDRKPFLSMLRPPAAPITNAIVDRITTSEPVSFVAGCYRFIQAITYNIESCGFSDCRTEARLVISRSASANVINREKQNVIRVRSLARCPLLEVGSVHDVDAATINQDEGASSHRVSL